jgi:hypothetical protein
MARIFRAAIFMACFLSAGIAFAGNILHCCERLGLEQRHEQGNAAAARARDAELHRELCLAYSSCG